MRSRNIVATIFVLLCAAGSASGQTLSMEFRDGRVRLKADNVPVSRILSEWTRIGGTTIVHGERVPGAPITLEITDLPERQALEIVLRGAAGYMVLARETTPAGASTFDKILVLPTTARAPAAPTAPQPPPPAPPSFPGDADIDGDDPNQAPFTPPPAGAFPRGRVPNVNRPQGVPMPAPQPSQPPTPQQLPAQDEDDDDPAETPEPTPPPSGNPFGVVPGGARPGTISPVPQQPNAGPQQNARPIPGQQPNAGQQPR
jgi:hypothetical protein